MIDLRREAGREALNLALPIHEKRRGRGDQNFAAVQFSAGFKFCNAGNDLHGFAEPHVVSQKRSEPKHGILNEPREAADLIGAKNRIEFHWGRQFLDGSRFTNALKERLGGFYPSAVGGPRKQGAEFVPVGEFLLLSFRPFGYQAVQIFLGEVKERAP